MVKAGKDSVSTVFEVWESSRLAAELQVPAKLHGSFYNDGWFSTGAVWDPSETRVAYVAEVRALILWPLGMHGLLIDFRCRSNAMLSISVALLCR